MKSKLLTILWMVHVSFMFFIFPFFVLEAKSNILGIVWLTWFGIMGVLLIVKDSNPGYSNGDW